VCSHRGRRRCIHFNYQVGRGLDVPAVSNSPGTNWPPKTTDFSKVLDIEAEAPDADGINPIGSAQLRIAGKLIPITVDNQIDGTSWGLNPIFSIKVRKQRCTFTPDACITPTLGRFFCTPTTNIDTGSCMVTLSGPV
jgi:hypothetical protein